MAKFLSFLTISKLINILREIFLIFYLKNNIQEKIYIYAPLNSPKSLFFFNLVRKAKVLFKP